MIIRFLKNTELNDRIYLASQAYELNDAQAAELIAAGVAVDAPPEPKFVAKEKPVKKQPK